MDSGYRCNASQCSATQEEMHVGGSEGHAEREEGRHKGRRRAGRSCKRRRWQEQAVGSGKARGAGDMRWGAHRVGAQRMPRQERTLRKLSRGSRGLCFLRRG